MDSIEVDNPPIIPDLGNHNQEMDYKLWSANEVAEHINSLTKQLSRGGFGLSPQILKLLLDRYRWNAHELSYDLMHNRKSVFRLAKIKDPVIKGNTAVRKIKKTLKKYTESDEKRCKLCNEIVHHDPSFEHCKHSYCRCCWSFCINTKYSREEAMTCPENKCLVAYDTVMFYLLKNRIRNFQNLTIATYVKVDPCYGWCPQVESCFWLIKVKNLNVKKVTCRCGMQYCFECKQKWHSPITCDMMKYWRELRIKQVQSRNSKKCRKCRLIIKKADKCPQCSLVMEEKDKLRNDSFYIFSNTYKLFKLENEFKRLDRRYFSENNTDEELQERNEAVRILGELRRVYKFCIVFVYFLRRDNEYANLFCAKFRLFIETYNNLVINVRHCYNQSQEIGQNIRNFAKAGYEMALTLENLCKDGFRNEWWNFKDIYLSFMFEM